MTENEVINGFKMDNVLLGDNEKGTVERNNLAIKALEEIQKYREIGTPQGFKDAIQSSIDNYNLMKEYKAKLQEYEEIGTIEQCHFAVERMKPKKPNIEPRRIVDCVGIPHDFNVKICPACGQQLEKVRFRKYPCECGQAIDLSEENE